MNCLAAFGSARLAAFKQAINILPSLLLPIDRGVWQGRAGKGQWVRFSVMRVCGCYTVYILKYVYVYFVKQFVYCLL